MQLEQVETFTIQGPQLEVFGKVEDQIPAPARKRPTAALVLAALALISVFGIGGVKLKGQYTKTLARYSASNSYNQGIRNDLSSQADTAANLIRKCTNVLGTENTDAAAAAAALAAWNQNADSPHPAQDYTLNRALYQSVTAMYNAAVTKADSDVKREINGLYDEFTSAQAVIDRAAGGEYNTAADAYNKTASSFPASLIGRLWGCSEAERFAAG